MTGQESRSSESRSHLVTHDDSELVPASATLAIVKAGAAADVLMDPRALRHLAPFLGRELTIGQAAAESGEKPNTTLARARRYLELGLLEVTGAVRRNGRPMKLYRTVADVFFVPFEATRSDSLEAALAERDSYWEALLRRNVVKSRLESFGNWGTRIYRDERGRLQVQTAVTPDANATTLHPAAPAVFSAWRDAVMLDFEDAKALQRELFELLTRYQRLNGSQRYVLRLAMAPVLVEA